MDIIDLVDNTNSNEFKNILGIDIFKYEKSVYKCFDNSTTINISIIKKDGRTLTESFSKNKYKLHETSKYYIRLSIN